MASRAVMALLVLILATTCLLTAAQQNPGPECTGEPRCSPPLTNDQWVSNISTVFERATSTRLEWDGDTTSQGSPRYVLVWRDVDNRGSYRQTQPTRNLAMGLTDLEPESRYTALVCRTSVNISELPSPPDQLPHVPECGFCSVCFETVAQQLTFETTRVDRVNETYVNLTCRVRSNAGFEVFWSAVPLDDATRRRRLDDRDRFDGERVAVSSNSVMMGMDVVVTSSLVAPEIILEQDVECTAESNFESGSSRRGAFELEGGGGGGAGGEVEGGDGGEVDGGSLFPEWAIAMVVVVATLVAGAIVVMVVVCVVQRRKKKKKRRSYNEVGLGLQDTELRQRIDSNDYLESSLVLGKDHFNEKLYSGEEKGGASFKVDLPQYMIIDRSSIDVSTVIGQGEFGVVYKGHLRRGSVSDVVAVKSLKGIFVTENDVQNALKEISKMKDFDHPNVMTLVGVCKATEMSGGAPSIIMPYMARGSLLSYLRKERDGLLLSADVDVTQVGAVQKLLMQICLQISQGMAYLASLRFVHRDLAARNCMIDDRGVIKVADFGLAEDIYMRNYFRQSSQDTAVKLPLKWMAPESIKLGIFSEKSDVWSYGVTCWEVFTAGEIPYPGIHPKEVVQLLEDGEHLKRPKNSALSDNMFGYMKSCWSYRPEDRLEFEELVSTLNKELTTLADYVDLSMITEVNAAIEE